MWLRLVNTSPLSEHSRNGVGTRPKGLNQLIRVCSNAATAVLALPLRDRCQSSNSWVWQSITSARLSQSSRPPQTQHKSVDQRSSGWVATEGSALIWGCMPIVRLRICQPFSWKMRCTVFLFMLSRPTVR